MNSITLEILRAPRKQANTNSSVSSFIGAGIITKKKKMISINVLESLRLLFINKAGNGLNSKELILNNAISNRLFPLSIREEKTKILIRLGHLLFYCTGN